MKFSRWFFWLQYCIDNCLILFSYCLVRLINLFYFRFSLLNQKSLRRQFKDIVKNTQGALLICPNHLTYIDSLIIQFGIASLWAYITKPSTYAWNLPKKTNVKSSRFFTFMCYLGKCILLPGRNEPEAMKLTMDKMHYLLQKKQYILVFPEGTRSNTGRVDDQNFAYGAGELLQAVPGTKVLCVYMRGDNQVSKSKFPIRGEKFSVALKLIEPVTDEKGLRGSRDFSRQIINTLVEMEGEYFARQS